MRRGNEDPTELAEAADARALRDVAALDDCVSKRPRSSKRRVNEESFATASGVAEFSIHHLFFKNRPHNAAVQRPRDQVSSAPLVHNEMTHLRRARADVSRSAATACYAAPTELPNGQAVDEADLLPTRFASTTR